MRHQPNRKKERQLKHLLKRILLFLWYWGPVAALMGFIFIQSSGPVTLDISSFPFQDKLLHFAAYGMLALLSARAVKNQKPRWRTGAVHLTAILIASLYGLTDELHQALVPQRVASFWDLAADCTGSLFGSLVYVHLNQKKIIWSAHEKKEYT